MGSDLRSGKIARKKKAGTLRLEVTIHRLSLARARLVLSSIEMPPLPSPCDADGAAAPKVPAAAPPPKKRERVAPTSQLEEALLEPTGDAGLSHEEAASRLARFGRNELSEHKTSKWLVFLKLVRSLETSEGERTGFEHAFIVMNWVRVHAEQSFPRPQREKKLQKKRPALRPHGLRHLGRHRHRGGRGPLHGRRHPNLHPIRQRVHRLARDDQGSFSFFVFFIFSFFSPGSKNSGRSHPAPFPLAF